MAHAGILWVAAVCVGFVGVWVRKVLEVIVPGLDTVRQWDLAEPARWLTSGPVEAAQGHLCSWGASHPGLWEERLGASTLSHPERSSSAQNCRERPSRVPGEPRRVSLAGSWRPEPGLTQAVLNVGSR